MGTHELKSVLHDIRDAVYDAPLREVVLAMSHSTPCCINGGDTILEALASMDESGTSAIVVLAGADGAGILTAEDCAFSLLLEGRDPGKTKCSEIARKNNYIADANITAGECLDYMLRHGVDYAVVSFGGYPVGCVSAATLLTFLGSGENAGSRKPKRKARAAARSQQP